MASQQPPQPQPRPQGLPKPQPQKRIVLRVAEAHECPLYKAGDQMVIRLPGVDLDGSTEVCTLALSKFLPVTQKIDCGKFKLVLRQFAFRCPRPHDPVRFEVEVEEITQGRTQLINKLAGNEARSIAALKQIPIFKPLSANALRDVLSMLRIERFDDGETIISRGQPGKALFIVYRGEVRVMGANEKGKTSVVRVLRERQCFGEMSLLTGAPTNATVVAKGEVSLLAMGRNEFQQLLARNPVLASLFTRLLAERLTFASGKLASLEGRAFAGKLSAISLAEVIQSLAEGRRSGTLVVETEDDKTGRIGFRDGNIWRVRRGEKESEEQLYRMLGWAEGDFHLDPDEVPEVDMIEQSVMNLLLEGMRRLDELALESGEVEAIGDVPISEVPGTSELPLLPEKGPSAEDSGPYPIYPAGQTFPLPSEHPDQPPVGEAFSDDELPAAGVHDADTLPTPAVAAGAPDIHEQETMASPPVGAPELHDQETMASPPVPAGAEPDIHDQETQAADKLDVPQTVDDLDFGESVEAEIIESAEVDAVDVVETTDLDDSTEIKLATGAPLNADTAELAPVSDPVEAPPAGEPIDAVQLDSGEVDIVRDEDLDPMDSGEVRLLDQLHGAPEEPAPEPESAQRAAHKPVAQADLEPLADFEAKLEATKAAAEGAERDPSVRIAGEPVDGEDAPRAPRNRGVTLVTEMVDADLESEEEIPIIIDPILGTPIKPGAKRSSTRRMKRPVLGKDNREAAEPADAEPAEPAEPADDA